MIVTEGNDNNDKQCMLRQTIILGMKNRYTQNKKQHICEQEKGNTNTRITLVHTGKKKKNV